MVGKQNGFTRMTLDDKMRDVGDAAAVVSGFAVFLQFIPAVVGIVTIIYTVFRIVESLDHRKRDGMWPFAPFGSAGHSHKKPD